MKFRRAKKTQKYSNPQNLSQKNQQSRKQTPYLQRYQKLQPPMYQS
jgi:hypothetical protein